MQLEYPTNKINIDVSQPLEISINAIEDTFEYFSFSSRKIRVTFNFLSPRRNLHGSLDTLFFVGFPFVFCPHHNSLFHRDYRIYQPAICMLSRVHLSLLSEENYRRTHHEVPSVMPFRSFEEIRLTISHTIILCLQ